MPLPERFRSAFTPSTIRQLDTLATKLQVREPLFFRSAYTATVIESERRAFRPVAVVDGEKVTQFRCACSLQLRAHDLCRHLGVMLMHATVDGQLVNERYESSVWRAIGFEAFSEDREIGEVAADAREELLRKYALTAQEQELVRRGAGSTRLLWESSPWYRWSKSLFLRFGNAADAALAVSADRCSLFVGDLEVAVPRGAVETLVQAADGAIARAGGYAVERDALAPSLRIELTADHALRFVPVLIAADGTTYDRAQLPQFGRWFLDRRTFATVQAAPPMFADERQQRQAALFETRSFSGLPYERETIVAPGNVLAFVDRHRGELSRMPAALAPECIRNARPMQLDDEVVFDFAKSSSEVLDVAISFRVGDETVSAAEIAKARRDGLRALIRGNSWVDVDDPQFAWLDGTKVVGNGRLLVTKLEYLRIRGSLRGKAVFRGDEDAEQVFRIFDELQSTGDAPADLGMDLYGYQQTGYRWLWLLQQNGFGGLLCDDMGLGKTHQAMALIRALSVVRCSLSGAPREQRATNNEQRTTAVLIVTPTSVLDHWREKLARYVGPAHIHHGSGRELRDDAPLVVTSYGVVRSDLPQLRRRKFDLLILDEIQTIKNPDTATHQALRNIDRRVAIGLTGTPVENHEGELHTLVDFVVPGYLPRHVHDRATLQRLVRPFVLRRTKAQVLTELPPKIVDKRYCDLSPEQSLLYRQIIDAKGKPLRAQMRSGARVPYIHVFAALNYLKQICNHPASLRQDGRSGKWDLFVELLDECMGSGLKVVVFSQYLAMLRLIEDHLRERGIGFASIKGATRDRGAETRRFRDDPDCRVFTASLKAAGLGIDLTSASVVIHYDRWWNQAREDQATDRVHRLGQSKGVQVIKLITRGTLEEKIDQLVERKAALAAELVQADDPALVKQFTVGELEELLDWQ